MPRSKLNVKRPKPVSEDVEAAAKAVLQNQLSLRQASLDFKVSKATLCRHLKKHRESGNETFVYSASQDVKLVFTLTQEKELLNYVSMCAEIHYGLSTVELRKLAYNYARVNNIKFPPSWTTNQIAGKEWYRYFRGRHPSISLRKPQATSLARATAFNKTNVNIFFDKLEELMLRYTFGPERIYNLDETGMSTVHSPVRVIATKGAKQVGSITSAERGANVTLICCVNAIGNCVPPLFVFPRVFFKDHMLKGAPIGSIGSANVSGWSNAKIFVEYLEHYIKHTQSSIDNKSLLIVDNHESHISVEALNLAKSSGVVILTFPPHTSHKLQPLDRSIFGPLKKFYNSACSNWLMANPAKTMTIYDVAECAGKAYPQAFTQKNIQSGFSVSGIFPFNRNVFEEHEFLSSYVTDRPVPVEPANELNVSKTIIPIGNPEASAATPPPGPSISALVPNVYQHRSPEEIRPFPKAALRKDTKKRGKKPGRCRIVTDTPEKFEIEMMTLLKKNKNFDLQKKKVTKKICDSSSSDEDLSEKCDSSLSDINFTSAEEDDIIECNNPSVGDFILVQIPTKKTKKYFIAHIIEANNDIFNVKYLKKSRFGTKFYFQDDTVYELPAQDVIMKLGSPTTVGGTARRNTEMTFSVDLSPFNVE